VSALAVAPDEEPRWRALGHAVVEEAGKVGLAPGPGGALAVLAPQDRFARFLRGTGPVLTPTDCGLVSFAHLRQAASDREVWAVHPQTCAVRRARAALAALVQAVSADKAPRGTALTADGAPLGDGWLISRLPWTCAARTTL
jgi:hypothetical protein